MLTENLWPKLFSEAPRCAPLRLIFSKASGVPSRKSYKLNDEEIFSSVGIAQPRERFTSGQPAQPERQNMAVENVSSDGTKLGLTL